MTAGVRGASCGVCVSSSFSFVSHRGRPPPALSLQQAMRRAIATFSVVNDGQTPLSPRTVSFGQVFRKGAVFPKGSYEARINDAPAALQIDSKAFYPDGSVRHAILTVEAPELPPHEVLKGAILKSGKAAPSKLSGAPSSTVPPLDITVTLQDGTGTPKRIAISLPVLAKDPARRQAKAWIDGPLAREVRLVAPVTERLEIEFDLWTPRLGPSRIDVVFHNDWAGAHARDLVTYDVEISLGGSRVYEASSLRHYPYATWHQLIWTDGQRPPRIAPDLDLLIDTGAVPRYATTLRVDRGVMIDLSERLKTEGFSPLGSAMVTRYMPSTGGRMDIGPLPAWAVFSLLGTLPSSRAVLLANADAAGSIPWHIRSRATRRALTTDAYPYLWLNSRGEPDPTVMPEPFDPSDTDWTLDNAHQPSLVYLPYLLTGLAYYRDELEQQAAYVLLSNDPGYRGGSQGLFIGERGDAWLQVRALAWSLRTLANAAYVLPADDPLQAYFEEKLRANLKNLVDIYVVGRTMQVAGDVEGWVAGDNREIGATSPWQEDFLATVLDWINEMGYPDAGRLLAWMSNFLAGRFTSASQGFDPIYGVAYFLVVSDPVTTMPYDDWASVFHASPLAGKPDEDVREEWNNYGGIACAALAGAYSITHSPRVAEALAYAVAKTPDFRTRYAQDPTFAIVPRLPDGTRPSLQEVQTMFSAASPKP